jgi:hypothetical protein
MGIANSINYSGYYKIQNDSNHDENNDKISLIKKSLIDTESNNQQILNSNRVIMTTKTLLFYPEENPKTKLIQMVLIKNNEEPLTLASSNSIIKNIKLINYHSPYSVPLKFGLVLKDKTGKSTTNYFTINPTDSNGISFSIVNTNLVPKDTKNLFYSNSANIELQYYKYPEIDSNIYLNKNYPYIDSIFGITIPKHYDILPITISEECNDTTLGKVTITEQNFDYWSTKGYDLIFKKSLIYKNISSKLKNSQNCKQTDDVNFCLISKKLISESKQALIDLLEEIEKSKATVEKILYVSDLSKDNTIKEEIKILSYNIVETNSKDLAECIQFIPSPKSIISITLLIETLYCGKIKFINEYDSSNSEEYDSLQL